MPLGTTIHGNEYAYPKNFTRENNEDSSEEERYMIGKSAFHLKDSHRMRVYGSR